jgi:hypothetical protein
MSKLRTNQRATSQRISALAAERAMEAETISKNAAVQNAIGFGETIQEILEQNEPFNRNLVGRIHNYGLDLLLANIIKKKVGKYDQSKESILNSDEYLSAIKETVEALNTEIVEADFNNVIAEITAELSGDDKEILNRIESIVQSQQNAKQKDEELKCMEPDNGSITPALCSITIARHSMHYWIDRSKKSSLWKKILNAEIKSENTVNTISIDDVHLQLSHRDSQMVNVQYNSRYFQMETARRMNRFDWQSCVIEDSKGAIQSALVSVLTGGISLPLDIIISAIISSGWNAIEQLTQLKLLRV